MTDIQLYVYFIGFVFLDFDSCKIKMDKVSSEIDQIFQRDIIARIET